MFRKSKYLFRFTDGGGSGGGAAETPPENMGNNASGNAVNTVGTNPPPGDTANNASGNTPPSNSAGQAFTQNKTRETAQDTGNTAKPENANPGKPDEKAEIETLKKQIDEQNKQLSELKENLTIERVLAGVTFVNNRTRSSVVAEIREKSRNGDDDTKISAYIAELQKNEPDIFKQEKPLGLGLSGTNGTGTLTSAQEQIAKAINGT